MTPDADVIVAGAGPSGSIAAYRLAKAGLKVIVLEKERFPRYKVCGGGLTHKILEEIPFSLEPVIGNAIHSVRFSHNFTDSFTRTSREPMMYCTMRSCLDAFLLERAVEAGALVRQGEQLLDVVAVDGLYEVTTSQTLYRSRIVIGADGASGRVSRASGLYRNLDPGLAWEAEVEAAPEEVERFRDTVFLDWGTFPGGYGWIFPKQDHFSAGVGGPAQMSGYMMKYYDGFLASTGMHITRTRSLKAWPIPVKMKRDVFHKDGILLTGDAAGLTDPLTGEGIYYAVFSANLAASAILEYLEGRSRSLKNYSLAVNDLLMTELLEARRIRDVINAAPARIHGLVRDRDRVWRAFGKILRGERRYTDVRERIGRWRHFWRGICLVCGIIYTFKLWFRRRF